MTLKRKLLLVTFGILVVLAPLAIYSTVQVRTTSAERAKTLAGEDVIPQPIGAVNHAITIHRSQQGVWPWLAQMGSGRAV